MAGMNIVAYSTAALLTVTSVVAQTPYVMMSDHGVVERLERVGFDNPGTVAERPEACDLIGLAHYGQDVPGGGTLGSIAFADGATISSTGRIAFVSRIDGTERNQGIFSAGEDGLLPIVIGCGGGGGSGDPGSGCGDPSPIGGTFSGVFPGTPPSAPPINNIGDILFLSDIDRGDSPRGLFLYQADTGDIRKVVAVGDDSPLGGTFSSIGPGSLNNSRQVVFLALTGLSTDGNLFLWDDGVISKVAAAGDPAPGGGFFWGIGTERLGYRDGTTMPTGPLGAINDVGQISFRGYVTGGESLGGIFLSDGTTHQWYVRVGDPTPMGGTYADFAAASLNNAGEVAFFADVRVDSSLTSGWFAGQLAQGDRFLRSCRWWSGLRPRLFAQSAHSIERRWALVALGRYPYRVDRLRAAVDQRARRKSLRRSSSRRLHSLWRPDRAPSSLAIPKQRWPGHGGRVDARCWWRVQRIHDFSVLYALALPQPLAKRSRW